MTIANITNTKYIINVLNTIILIFFVYAGAAYSQERRARDNYPQQQNQAGPITSDYVQKVLEQLKAPPALAKDVSSAEIKLQLKNLNDRNRSCLSIWISNKPDVRISQWSDEQRKNFAEICKDTESKLNELKNWANSNLSEIEKNENKLAQDKTNENRNQFMAVQPDYILLANTKHPQLVITKKLDGSFVIESKAKGTLSVGFNNSTDKNYAYSTRFFSLNQFVLVEIGDRVNEMAAKYGVNSQLLFEKNPGFFIKENSDIKNTPGIRGAANSNYTKDSHFFLIDKMELDKIKNLIESGSLINLGVINSVDVFKNAKITQDKSEKNLWMI
jgi:hypothetical protein